MLSSVSDSSITSQLKARLAREEIYTSIGQVLVSMNPFKQLPIYDANFVQLYARATGDTPPHIFHLADEAYRGMCAEGVDQSIIISGESGAGKTEAAKLILQYISAVSGTSASAQYMKDCIYQTNPILESFGNAKTIRNNNSSRFGKYLQIFFNGAGEPASGKTLQFLLEKTRVAFQGNNERNFHIFYQLLRGSTVDEKKTYGFEDKGDPCQFLLCGSCVDVEGVDDAKDFAGTRTALEVVGVNPELQQDLFALLAGILHLGNMTFTGGRSSLTIYIETIYVYRRHCRHCRPCINPVGRLPARH